MATALDLITQALQELGAIAISEAPSADEAAGALFRLNSMLDGWKNENMLTFSYYTNMNFLPMSLVANQAEYSIGGLMAGSFPHVFRSLSVRDKVSKIEYPLEIITVDEYASISLKNMTSQIPQYAYINQGNIGSNVTLFPVPSSDQYELIIWVNSVGVPATLTLSDSVPDFPGFKRAIISNLAIELAPAYGKVPSPVTVEVARKSKAEIKRHNLVLNTLEIDPRLQRNSYNYYTDNY